jgi:hypothetical protein
MSATPPPIPNPPVRPGARRSPDDEAMSIIHRAAALIKKQDGICTTPGARYMIRFQDNIIACTVRLPSDLGMTVGELLDRYPYLGKFLENDVHDMMANAVEKVIAEIRSKVMVEETKTFWRDNPGAKVLPDHLLPAHMRKTADVAAT